MTESNVPSLRFTDFSDDWKELSFGQIATFKNGLNYSKENAGKGLKIIGVSNFKNFFSIGYNDLDQISGFDKIDESYLLKEHDIIFVRSNGNKALIGRALFINNIKSEKITHSGFTIRARITSPLTIPVLVAYIFQSEKTKQQILFESGGTNISNLSQEILSKITFYFPSLLEQQKIASFLTAIDAKIELLTKKKVLLEQYKKGVMQQLFSRQIRFKDEGGNDFPDWKEKTLGEITYKVDKKNKRKESLPVYSISNTNGFVPQSEQFDGVDSNERGYDISLYKVVEKETFAYNPARINVGSIGYSGSLEKVIVSSLYVCFKTKEEVEDTFFNYFLQTQHFKTSVLKNGEGGVRIYLFYENFSAITIQMPSSQEQLFISNFLLAVDSKIALACKQVEFTQTYKKGLLQQLFF